MSKRFDIMAIPSTNAGGYEHTVRRLETFSDIIIALTLSQLAFTLRLPHASRDIVSHRAHHCRCVDEFRIPRLNGVRRLLASAADPRFRDDYILRSTDRAARILALVRAIPRGFVQTYGDLDPHAPRFAGHVLATAPADVPWHRVVRSDGSAAQGRKQLERLRKELVPIRNGRVNIDAARWPREAEIIKTRSRASHRHPKK